MKAADIDINLVESYFRLLKNLNTDSKLELISKLLNSMKSSRHKEKDSVESLYGAFISEESADELVRQIKQSRNFNRKREEF